MPPDGVALTPRDDLLTAAEVVRLVRERKRRLKGGGIVFF
jgi:hypothetical protein